MKTAVEIEEQEEQQEVKRYQKTYRYDLVSTAPYSPGRGFDKVEVPREPEEESDADYEKRNWRKKCHVTSTGYVCIPAIATKDALTEIARQRGQKIEGKRGQTFAKYFERAVFIGQPIVLDTKLEDVQPNWLFVPSDGKHGGPKRVSKCFPLIQEWRGSVEITVLDVILKRDVITTHLDAAGIFIGFGTFRPQKGGYFGRFKIEGDPIEVK